MTMPSAGAASRLAARLLRLFPAAFRRRYGDELVQVYVDLERAGRPPGRFEVLCDLVRAAVGTRFDLLVDDGWAAVSSEPASEPVTRSAATYTPGARGPRRIPTHSRGPDMHGFLRDLRLAFRGLRRAPGFTVVAVATLALGIGANAAIFGVVHGVLLRALDLSDPERLVKVWHVELDDAEEISAVSPGNFRDWREQSGAFEALAAYGFGTKTLHTGSGDEGSDGGESLRVQSLHVTGEFFQVAGVDPVAGTLLTPEDDAAGSAADKVVLSYGAWRRYFGEDRSIVGQTVRLDGTATTVAGVLPPGFQLTRQAVDVYVPMGWSEEFRGERTEYSYRCVGRLAEGVTLAEAEQRVDAVMARLREEFPVENGEIDTALVPLQQDIMRPVKTPIWLVMGAVGLVLLIGCANLAQLLLARAESRRKEVAVRRALGATGWTLLRQSLTESVVLAVVGGAVGLAVARWTLGGLKTFLPADLPGVDTIGIDPLVFAFTGAVSVLAGLLFGALPALRLPRLDQIRPGRGVAGHRQDLSGSLLTIGEVALAVVLLCGTGLLLRSLQTALAVEPGYATNVLSVRAHVSGARYESGADRVRYFEQARAALAALPSVEGVSVGTSLPPEFSYNNAWFRRQGQVLADGETPPWISYRVVLPDYLETLDAGLIAGRFFDAREDLGAAEAGAEDGAHDTKVILNQAAIDRFFGGESAQAVVGHRVILGPDNTFPPATVIGVVDDGLNLSLREGGPMVYMPYAVLPLWSDLAIGVRTRVDPATLTEAVTTTLRELDPQVAVYGAATFDELHREQMELTRAIGSLLGGFAFLGLVMAAVGLFGVLSYQVHHRRREMGIRLALGARAAEVRRLVVGQGLAKVAIGLVLGVGAALLLTRFLEGLVFGIAATDPWTYLGVAAVLLVSALLACWWPAHRASSVAPAEVLHQD